MRTVSPVVRADSDPVRDLQKKSSAVTLSDMEMFIFPDLIFSLVLANIMSPEIWKWRDDPWFAGMQKKGMTARINRLKQYIMDRYTFNLDLDTWGLTTQEREIGRFSGFIDRQTLAQSNALFGYEGDKYYFDIDIRRHFGLDKYDSSVIPYWKTETVEAMTAFVRRDGYECGAGECVSLAALYAAALFIVLGVPLSRIYLMATPLHSQNFIDVDDGIITNNRRIVTKKMWCNGTELSAQARRAIEHEKITFVAHETGWIHTVYSEATIDREVYRGFSEKLESYLFSELTPELLGNFLRQSPKARRCFYVRASVGGRGMFLELERAFAYEADVSYKVTDETRNKLLACVEQGEFVTEPCSEALVLDDIEEYLREHPVDVASGDDVKRFVERFACPCVDVREMMADLISFCRTRPRLPSAAEKEFVPSGVPLGIEPGMTREEIIDRVMSLRRTNEYCRMAVYAWRDMRDADDEEPFLLAARERNPVCITESAEKFPDDAGLVGYVLDMCAESIYSEPFRMAQPDEVWNFRCGDGAERALMLAVALKSRHPERKYKVELRGGSACVLYEDESGAGFVKTAEMPSSKSLGARVWAV